MSALFKRSTGAIMIALLLFTQAFAFHSLDDQKDLAALADDFAVAMIKKDKAWLDANLTAECVTQMPNSETWNRQFTIQAFTGTVYDIKKSSAGNKTFTVSGNDADGSADYTVEGATSDGNDIAGTYKLSLKFKKTDTGWKISGILVNGN